jgi:hypothetical protein
MKINEVLVFATCIYHVYMYNEIVIYGNFRRLSRERRTARARFNLYVIMYIYKRTDRKFFSNKLISAEKERIVCKNRVRNERTLTRRGNNFYLQKKPISDTRPD